MMFLPLALSSIGLLASIAGILIVRCAFGRRPGSSSALGYDAGAGRFRCNGLVPD